MITELCEACYDVWFVDSDTGGEKRGGGGNRAEDVKVFIEMTRVGSLYSLITAITTSKYITEKSRTTAQHTGLCRAVLYCL